MASLLLGAAAGSIGPVLAASCPATDPGVRQLAAGLEHSCALLASGSVRCWGSNRYGELGDGSAAWMSPTPVPVAGLADATQLAAFGRLTCAVRRNGQVVCWGMPARVADRQPPAVGPRAGPRPLSDIDDAVAVAVGADHLCILDQTGQMRCGGFAVAGAGPGATLAPELRGVLGPEQQVRQLAAGAEHDCALTAGGEVYCRGRHWLAAPGTPGSLGPPRPALDTSAPILVPGLSGVVQITAGASHSCARLDDGTVYCWGYNAEGQAGPDGLGGYLGRPRPVPGLVGASDVQAGTAHTCAVVATGAVRCWGSDHWGQLGTRPAPSTAAAWGIAPAVSGVAVVRALAAGHAHNCAVVANGDVICWGSDRFGQSGTDPIGGLTRLDGLGDIAEIAAGDRLCLSSAGGSVACLEADEPHPIPLTGPQGVVAIAVDRGVGCAVDGGGGVWCWGRHLADGEQGVPALIYGDGREPSRIEGIDTASAVAVGLRHACALLAGGTVACWGTGWLGDDRRAVRGQPVVVADLDAVRAIAAGPDRTLAVRSDGSVYCWGDCPELGGSALALPRPQRLPGIDDARGVVAGSSTCLLHMGGAISCIGPLAGPGGPPRAAVSLSMGQYGQDFACLLDTDGRVACWGDNRAGQLGDGTRRPRNHAVAVLGITDATQVAAGVGYACALLNGGGLRCWGERSPGRERGRGAPPTRIEGLGAPVGIDNGCLDAGLNRIGGQGRDR